MNYGPGGCQPFFGTLGFLCLAQCLVPTARWQRRGRSFHHSAAGAVWTDQNRCSGCDPCLQACGRKLIALQNGLFQVLEPRRCAQCGHCKAVCPGDAPQLPLLEAGLFTQAPPSTCSRPPICWTPCASSVASAASRIKT
ncbi:hypothetical protein DFAR_3800035 [Desulfarculales bacterium]